MKFWCSQAKNYTLQREHLGFHPSLDEVPDEAIAEALIIESGPDEKPMPDDEYDAHVALTAAGITEEVEDIMADPESSDSDVADSDVAGPESGVAASDVADSDEADSDVSSF